MRPDAPMNAQTAAEERKPGYWLSEDAQVAFFETVLAESREALAATETRVCRLELAGTIVELRCAGNALATRFFPALSHLVVGGAAAPDVTFLIWDTVTTGVAISPPPCKPDCFTNRGDIWGMSSPRIRSAFHWSEFSVNLFDAERRLGIFWVRDQAELPYWTTSSPLRTLFHWWMEANGAQLLHAAAVGTPAGALLITGKGGVGKSSTALACLQAGMQYVADDYLVVTLDPVPTAVSLYCTAKLDPGQVERFPALAGHIANPGYRADEKAVLQLWPERSGQIVRSLPLKAIATPCFIPESGTGYAAADADRLERAAAFTTMSQLPHAGSGTAQFVKRLVGALPGLELRLGSDLTRIPEAIASILEEPAHLLAGALAAGPDSAPRAHRRPLISVIIPVYNGAHFLGDAVANVLSQRYDPLDIIVVDDGSTDDIAAAVARLPVEVRYLRQDNGGAASARNRGIRDASGDLIAFLDVDDLWPDGNLETLLRWLEENPDADVVHGRGQVTQSSAGRGIGEFIGNPDESFACYIGAGLYRRRAFERVGFFDTDLRYGEDADWFQRAQEVRLAIARLDMVTLFVRRHGGNMTRGKTLVELNLLRVLKKRLERQKGGAPDRRDLGTGP